MRCELEPGCFESLFLVSQLQENSLLNKFLKTCGSWTLDEDYYAISWEAMNCVFADFAVYSSEEEIETLVFFDPVIYEFYRLCTLYELKNPGAENVRRQNAEREIYGILSLNAYDYDCRLYDGSHGRPRLVILTGPEFYGHSELPGALAEVRSTLEEHSVQLRRELGLAENNTPVPDSTGKEAA